MSVKFVIDSASDLLPDEAGGLGVTVLPMQVTFGDRTYEDGVTLSHEEFYKKLESGKEFPTTSQISPGAFGACFEDLTADGSELVVITISSKFSGTYQSACIAAADFDGRVFVVDSLSLSLGERVLLMRGLELEAEGIGAGEIAAKLDEEKKRLHVIAMMDTLEYLKKGGRISPTVAFAGGLLGIKPAVQVIDGQVVLAGTARGAAKCHALVKSLIDSHGGMNWAKPVALVYSASDKGLQEFLGKNPELFPVRCKLPVHSLGCAVGAHIGPGAYGVAFFEK